MSLPANRVICQCKKCKANARRIDWFTLAELESEVARRRALDAS